MGTHKQIGKAVKDKLASYNDAPDDSLWASIEQSLGEQKKKRRFPIWWWLTGGIILGIIGTMGYINLTNNDSSALESVDNKVVEHNIEKTESQSIIESEPESNEKLDTIIESNSIVSIENIKNNRQSTDKTTDRLDNEISVNSNSEINNSSHSRNTRSTITNKSTERLLAKNNTTYSPSKEKLTKPVSMIVVQGDEGKNTELVVQNQSQKNRRDSIKAVNEKNRLQRIEKRKLLAELKENKPKDSTENNSSKLKLEESPWSVTAMGIVTHYQNLNNGNSLDRVYDDLLVEDRLSLNYGASLNFITNDYLQLRIGINHMRFNQTTKSISADFNELTDLQYVSYEVEDGAIASFLASDTNNTIEIDHDLNYIEIPLEVRLRLNNDNLEVSTIFGISYMMLIDQYFTARNSNRSLRFGRATFINDANFNVNAGFGLRYPIYNRFYLNTDFMFKYQIKTYSQTRDIDPAYFNIQVGIEYKL